MTDRKITLQLDATQVGYVLASLRLMSRELNGPQASLIQKEIGELISDVREQTVDDTLQGAGLEARSWPRGPIRDRHGAPLGADYTEADMRADDDARNDEYEYTELMSILDPEAEDIPF